MGAHILKACTYDLRIPTLIELEVTPSSLLEVPDVVLNSLVVTPEVLKFRYEHIYLYMG